MSDDVRRLVVIRHAKAEPVASSDHARRLTDRGRQDAAEAGRWARAAGFLPDHALVSTAARAHETWTAFATAADADLVPDLDGTSSQQLTHEFPVPPDRDISWIIGLGVAAAIAVLMGLRWLWRRLLER